MGTLSNAARALTTWNRCSTSSPKGYSNTGLRGRATSMNTMMVRLVLHEALHHIDVATIRFCLGTHDHLEKFALNTSYMVILPQCCWDLGLALISYTASSVSHLCFGEGSSLSRSLSFTEPPESLRSWPTE